MKTVSRIILIAALFSGMLSFNTGKVHALSCSPRPNNIFVAAYEQGVFTKGFVIEHENTGGACETRPVVSDNIAYLQNAFSSATQNLNQPIYSGVYQLEMACWTGETCAELKQLSNEPSELIRYKAEWQQKEHAALRSVTTRLWLTEAIIVGVVMLTLIWPWILVKMWPNLRKRLSLLLIVAILLQAFNALSLPAMFVWDYRLWQTTASISSTVLFLAIICEIIFIIVRTILMIVRKIRRRNIPN